MPDRQPFIPGLQDYEAVVARRKADNNKEMLARMGACMM
jgi:hypothetical protein